MAQDDADAEAAESAQQQAAAYIPMPGLPPTSMPVASDLTMHSHSHLPTHVDMRSISRDPEPFHTVITAGGDYQ